MGGAARCTPTNTFGVWDGDTLVPWPRPIRAWMTREILALESLDPRHTRERFGPVRSVRPEHVFELGFEAVNRSSRHKSGMSPYAFHASCAGATTSQPARPISWLPCRRWRDEPQPGTTPAGRLVRVERLALVAVPARDVAALSRRRIRVAAHAHRQRQDTAMFGDRCLQAMIDPPPSPRRASAVRPLQVLWVTPLRALASDNRACTAGRGRWVAAWMACRPALAVTPATANDDRHARAASTYWSRRRNHWRCC